MTSYAIALTMIGRTDQASQAAEDEFAWAKTWGAPRFIGMALRAKAHATHDIDRIQPSRQRSPRSRTRPPGSNSPERSATSARRSGARITASRPRAKRRRALDLTLRCRADGLADHVRGELRAAGAKPRRDAVTGRDALTASETRIAEMAATGKTNAQIAQALFLTPGTIEKHLTSVYAKLDITTRRELPAALRNEPAPTPGR